MFKANLVLLVNSKPAKTEELLTKAGELQQRPCPYAQACPKSSLALWAALGMRLSPCLKDSSQLWRLVQLDVGTSSAGIASVLVTLVLKQ